MTPVFDWVEKKGLQPEVLLYFTDLAVSDFPKQPPPYETLWLEPKQQSKYRRQPGFGRCLAIQ